MLKRNIDISGFKIKRITNVSDALCRECYDIANIYSPSDNADLIFDTIQNDVNEKHKFMFSFEVDEIMYAFITGNFKQLPAATEQDLKVNNPANVDWLFSYYRGQGIGKILLNAYADFVKANGADYLFLRSVTEATNFYKKQGFETIGWRGLMGRSL